MKSLILCCLMLIPLAYSQDKDNGAVSVIAVGTAQDEKERIGFSQFTKSSMNANQTKVLQEVENLLKNDFAFYKHRIDAVETDDTVTGPMWDVWTGRGYSYVVGLRAQGDGNGVAMIAEVYSVREKKSRGTVKGSAGGTSLRDQGHKFADGIFRLINGKPSIFQSKIVFVSDRSSFGKDTRKELYQMDFDGRRVERLTFHNSTVISPAISPDNKRYLFSLIRSHSQQGGRRRVETKNIDLMQYDTVTKKSSVISGAPGVNSGAVYSADGKSIYFTMTTSGNADIYEMPIGGGSPRKITSHYGEDVDPTVTADGSSMSFLSSRAGRAHIYIMNPRGADDSKNVKRISFVGQFNASPRYSPNGREISFVSWVDNAFDLYRIDATGSNLVRLTKDFGSNEEPWWSPDGEFLIFTSQRVLNRREALQDIYIMNRDGEVLGQLTQGFGRCFTPRWSN